MRTVSLTIEDMAGKRFKAQMPSEVVIGRLIPLLVVKVGLSSTLRYRLMHVESGMHLSEHITLEQAQVRDHHTLKLIADHIAGHIRPSSAWEETPIKIFFCYARKDKDLRDELENHLEPLRRSGQITTWHDREIQPGKEWKKEIDIHLNSSNIVLLLVSPNFMRSDYCYGIEMRRAIERHETGEARVIPIILRPVDWKRTPIGELQALPRDGKPVTLWRNRDSAFESIVEGIDEVVRGLLSHQTYQNYQAGLVSHRTNQYYRAGPVTEQDYYRRDDIIEVEIRDCIHQGQAFGLFGPRRIGKSSILLEMKRKRSFGHACVSILNMQEFLGRSIWAVFHTAMQQWLQQLSTSTTTELEGEFSLAKMLITAGEDIPQDTIRKKIEQLISILPEKMLLALILDEVGEILPYPPDYQRVAFPDWREFLAFLRVLYYRSDRRFLVGLVGTNDEIIYSNFGGDSSYNPWWKQIRGIYVGPLTRPDGDHLVQELGNRARLRYTPEALSLLYDNTGGHPQVLRELCSRLAERPGDQIHTVQGEEVERTIQRYVYETPFLRSLYLSLEEKEQVVLVHLARTGEMEATSLYNELAKDFTDSSDFDKTLRILTQFGLIQAEETTHQVCLRLGLLKAYLNPQNSEVYKEGIQNQAARVPPFWNGLQ